MPHPDTIYQCIHSHILTLFDIFFTLLTFFHFFDICFHFLTFCSENITRVRFILKAGCGADFNWREVCVRHAEHFLHPMQGDTDVCDVINHLYLLLRVALQSCVIGSGMQIRYLNIARGITPIMCHRQWHADTISEHCAWHYTHHVS